MATKLYLESSGTPGSTSAGFNAGWSDTSIATRYPTHTTKAGSTMTTVNFTDASNVQADILFGQWISRPLASGQTITGAQTVSCVARFSEVSSNNNLFLTWGVYIFNGSTLNKT